MTRKDNIIVIANQASTELGCKVADELGLPFTIVTKKQFADGEIYHAFPLDISGKDIIVLGCTNDDGAHQELLDLLDGCHYFRAHSINVVVPYLGYSTMEQARPGRREIPKGITRTRQIFKARPDFVAFIDLHSESVLHAHKGIIHTMNISTDQLIVNKIKEMGLENYVLVSPDYGRSKWVARLAGLLDAPHTAADKDRFAMDKTMVGQVASVVKGKTVIICDDMIRTGGSIIQTALRCREAGALDTMLFATHLVLAGDARRKFAENNISRIIGSDTFPGVKNDDLLELYSVAPMIGRVMRQYLEITD
jgi:ribose-phosphate pyrophosphokinase